MSKKHHYTVPEHMTFHLKSIEHSSSLGSLQMEFEKGVPIEAHTTITIRQSANKKKRKRRKK